MHYEGKIYRPWPEAHSLLIQTTIGCTNNRCTFCDMFREKKFRIRKLEDVSRDIEEARQLKRDLQLMAVSPFFVGFYLGCQDRG